MKRKIIKQGHSTLTITLPSEWTKRFNLEAGKEVELVEKEYGLFITTEKINKCRKAEFDITGLDIPTIWKYFMAVYREGYDEVLVKFNRNIKLDNPYKFFTQHKLDLRYKREPAKKDIYEVLQCFVNRFIGFEIVEHGKNFVLIKEMGETSSKEFDNSVRRVFLLIQQMAEETSEAIKENNPKILAHIHDVDVNLDKFHDYCIRILNKTGNKESRKTSILFSTLYLLELLGDEYKNMAIHLIQDFQDCKMKNIEGIAKSIKKQFDLLYELFYKFDKEKVIQISEIDKTRYFDVINMYKNTKEEGTREIFHHLRIITRYLNALTELRIEMEF